MRSGAIRRIAQLIIIGAVLVLVAMAALPLVASTQIVRDRIAQELSLGTGYRVRVSGAPEIRIWPSFGARLSGVTFSEWNSGETVLSSDRAELDLSAVSALRGDVVFKEIDLTRPTFRMQIRDGRLTLPEPPAGGQFERAISAARRLIAENPAKLDVNKLPDIPFGTIRFTDGRIVVNDGGRQRDIATSINGTLDWPTLARGGRLDASGIWNGETVKASINSSQALYLMAGGDAPVEIKAESPTASTSFTGNVTLGDSIFVNGYASFASPAFGRVLEWTHMRLAPGSSLGDISIAGTVVGDLGRFKVENAEITLQGSSGTGVMEVAMADRPRRIAGTLAMERLDLRAFLAALAPLAVGAHDLDQPIDMSFTDDTGIDLRISANAATAGPLSFANLAAAVQISPGLAAFDISDATMFGGSVQASLRLDRKAEGNQAELRLNARQIDTAALSQTTGINRMLPIGRGDFSAMLKGRGAAWGDILASTDGTVGARFGQGSLPGLDVNAMLARAEKGGFFSLWDSASGSTQIAGAEVRAQVNNGSATLDVAHIRIDQNRTLDLTGLVPWMGQGLALSGRILTGTEATGSDSRPAFFVGGSWLSPYVWPIP
jgi:AsmA protein